MRHVWRQNGIDRRRRAGRLIMAALIAAFSTALAASAQTLDLSKPITPPELQQPTYAAHLISKLEREIADLSAREREQDEVQQMILRAAINSRLVAADLLAAGDRAGSSGSMMVLAGLRLAHNWVELDAALQKIKAPAFEGNAPLFHNLRAFNDLAAQRRLNNTDWERGSLDQSLAALFAPLARAVSEIENKPIESHWIVRQGPSSTDPSVLPTASLAELAGRLPKSSLPEQARNDLIQIVDFLQRGEQFPELRPRIEEYQHLIVQMLQFAEAIAAAAWLKPADRLIFDAQIDAAAVAFKSPHTRQEGLQQIQRLDKARVRIERLNRLDQFGCEVKPIFSSMLAAQALLNDPAQGERVQQQLDMLELVLGRMVAYRQLEPMNFKRDLRLIEREFHKAYRASEEALLRQLLAPSADGSISLTDPAFSSLVMDQQQWISDLQRLRQAPRWMQAIASIDSESSEPFTKKVHMLGKLLLDPARRPEAVATMDRFQQQLASFYPFPFEDQLRASEPAAINATGGLHQQLVAEINAQQRTWAQAWADGDAESQPGPRMLILHGLAQAMADFAEVDAHAARLEGLERWTPWELEPELFAQPASEVVNRLKLASAAVVGGDDAAAGDQLDRIQREAVLLRLAVRLARWLEEELVRLPDGPSAVLGKLVHSAPPTHAFMAEQRGALADVCRYALEMEHARNRGDLHTTEMLQHYVNALAQQLLDGLNRIEPFGN